MCGGDAVFCQITLTICLVKRSLTHGIDLYRTVDVTVFVFGDESSIDTVVV